MNCTRSHFGDRGEVQQKNQLPVRRWLYREASEYPIADRSFATPHLIREGFLVADTVRR